jgi:TP901 family phage tail tape measure protein
MVEEILKVGVEAQEAGKVLSEVQRAFKDIQEELIALTGATSKLDRETGELQKTYTGLTSTGDTFTAKFTDGVQESIRVTQKLNSELGLTAQQTLELSRSFEALTAGNLGSGIANIRQTIAQQSAGVDLNAGSSAEALGLNKAQEDLASLVLRIKAGSEEINQAFQRVRSGGISEFSKGLTALEAGALKVVEAERKIGSEAERSFEKASKGFDASARSAQLFRDKLQAIANEAIRAEQVTGGLGTRFQQAVATAPAGTTQGELINFQSAEAALERFARQNNIKIQAIDNAWETIAKGGILEYSEQSAKLTRLIQKAQTEQKAFGAEARKVADQQEKNLKELIALREQFDAKLRQSAALAQAENRKEVAAFKDQAEAQKLKVQLQEEFRRAVASSPQATELQKLDLTRALSQIEAFRQKNNLTFEELNAKIRQVADGPIEEYKADLIELRNIMNGATTAVQNLGAQSEQAINTATKSTDRFGLSFQNVARIVAISAIHRAVGQITSALREGIQAASELEIAVSEIRTISQNTQLTFTSFSQELKEVSNSFGLDILDTAEAAYQTLSNQVAEGAETFRFLEQASRFSIAAVSSQEDSVNLLTAAINAFGLEVSDTEKVAASFFKTIELGRVRASELSNQIGNILVPARQLGISMGEVQAAITTLTVQGVKANQSLTLIRNIVLKLIRPTDALKDTLRDMGFESGQAAIEALGFSGVLAELQKRTNNSATEIGELFGRIRAIVGVLGFAGEGLNIFNRNLNEIENSTESFNAAVEIGFESAAKRIQIETNKMANFFKVDLGQSILSTTADVNDAVGGFTSIVIALANTFKQTLIPTIGLVIIAIVNMTKAWIANRAAAVAAGKAASFAWGPVIAVITGVIVATNFAIQKFKEARLELVNNWSGGLDSIVEDTDEAVSKLTNTFDKSFKGLTQKLLKDVAGVRADLNRLIDENLENLDAALKDIKLSSDDALKGFKEELSVINSDLTRTTGELKKFENTITAIGKKKLDFALEVALGGGDDPAEQIEILKKNIQSLQKEGTRLVGLDLTDDQREDLSTEDRLKAEARLTVLRERGNVFLAKALDLTKELRNVSVETAEANEKAQDTIQKNQVKLQKLRFDFRKKDEALQLRISKLDEKTDANKIENLKEERAQLKKTSTQKFQDLSRDSRIAKESIVPLEKIDFAAVFKRLADQQIASFQTLADKRIESAKAIEELRGEAERKQIALTEAFRRVEATKGLIEDVSDVTDRDQLVKNQRERENALIALGEAQLGIDQDFESRQKLGIQFEKERAVFRAQADKLALANTQKLKTESDKELINTRDQLVELRKQQAVLETNFKLIRSASSEFEKAVGVFGRTPSDQVAGLGSSKVEQDRLRDLFADTTGTLGQLSVFGPADTPEKIKERNILLLNLKSNLDVLIPEIENAGKSGEPFAEVLNKVAQSLAEIDDIRDFTGGLSGLEELQQSILATDKELSVLNDKIKSDAIIIGVTVQKVKTVEDQRLEISKSLTAQYREQVRLARQLQEQAAEIEFRRPQKNGGLQQRFANGGMAGQDMIPALLSPGEFVVNAASARRFHSQLIGLNSDPSRFATGGTVGDTTNVGDIHINMSSSGNESFDVNRVGQLLRREIRRGTLKL